MAFEMAVAESCRMEMDRAACERGRCMNSPWRNLVPDAHFSPRTAGGGRHLGDSRLKLVDDNAKGTCGKTTVIVCHGLWLVLQKSGSLDSVACPCKTIPLSPSRYQGHQRCSAVSNVLCCRSPSDQILPVVIKCSNERTCS